ncbi:hypothetical protein MJA45_27315 [Paenibacillus aurantius]|uniref:Uncharacterized protein n=1 Tax=Paenibacillus aurantius TaxID=2918900 RepID=A0AA96RHM3_9BACL|nr:hypothetical protein [Paenibacillus aurantius]WNQ11264.1 hypothetical protein MJA45_27315 [Paenibacillus aurantius]
MRTELQIKRKRNELLQQTKDLQTRLADVMEDGEAERLKRRLEETEGMILLLDWVLNEPIGSYHA